jgi:ribonuclease Z
VIKEERETPNPPVTYDRAMTRRGLVGTGAALLGWATAPQLRQALVPETNAQTALRASHPIGHPVVTLLGTGTPIPLPDRFGPSTLVEAGGRRMLFDAGRGVPIRLNQLKTRLGDVDAVFLTHYHSDHINGLPDVWMTSYIPVAFGERAKPMRLWGPTGAARLASNLMITFSDDIRIRMADEHVPNDAARIEAHEFYTDGVVFDEGGVKVTAFEVNHGDLIKPAYGYRVDYAGRSVLISGDTKYNENVIMHGKGVDLLIHEVCAVPDALKSRPNIQAVINHHTSPEECGKIFFLTKPRLAAYTHLVLLSAPEIPPLSTQDVEKLTRQTYDGPLAIGEDLMRFVVGDKVTTQKWDAARNDY